MPTADFMTPRTHDSAEAYDPFSETRGPVGNATHFDVERIPGGAVVRIFKECLEDGKAIAPQRTREARSLPLDDTSGKCIKVEAY